MFVWEIRNGDESKPGKDPIEMVGCFLRNLEKKLRALAVDGAQKAQGAAILRGATSKDHGTPGGRQEVDRHKGRHGLERRADEGTDLARGHRGLNESEKESLSELRTTGGDPGVRGLSTPLLPVEPGAGAIEFPAVILVARALEGVDDGVHPTSREERHAIELTHREVPEAG